MKTSNFPNPAAPTLFASVRGSRDLSLVAFGAALLTAFALHAGAFVPRLPASQGREQAVAIPPATPAAVVASQPVPCPTPRG
jgi:hypothetical protein